MKLQDLESIQADSEKPTPVHRPTGTYRFGFAYGKFIHKTRWLVIVLWVIVLASSVPLAIRLPSILLEAAIAYPTASPAQYPDHEQYVSPAVGAIAGGIPIGRYHGKQPRLSARS